METIVELFTGFLDSGKTTLIREALHSPDFLDYNQTLLIVCEEGDEEYDEAWLKKNGIIKYVVDEEEKINEFFLEGLELNYRPDHVMIEWNGTWDVNRLLEANEENITGTLGNLNAASGDLARLLDAEKGRLQSAVGSLAAFADMLGENAPRVDSIVGNLNDVTAQLSEAEFARKLSDAVERFDGLLAKIDDGEGTLGRLMNDPALYDSLTAAGGNLASLLADLQRYPGRYVHFSLFGRDPEKMKAKADRKAARAAEKAERDSLRLLK